MPTKKTATKSENQEKVIQSPKKEKAPTEKKESVGKIVSIKGVVVEVSFEQGVPKVYDALNVVPKNANGKTVVIEVLQVLENGVVKGIAMDSTDGLKRGMKAFNTQKPISIPVGEKILGRIYRSIYILLFLFVNFWENIPHALA